VSLPGAAKTCDRTPADRARRVLLAVAALAACLAALALRPAPADALNVGFMDPGFQTDQPDVFWEDMSTLGANMTRYDVYWNEIARKRPTTPRDPSSPGYDWSTVDRLVRDAAAHQTEIILTVWRTPAWARATKSGGSGYAFTPNLNHWGAFIHAAAVRYSGTFDPDGAGPEAPLPLVPNWEIWNEPNYVGALRPQRAGGKVVSPKLYAGILNRAGLEIRAVKRALHVRMRVLGGAINRGFGGKGSVAALVFLRGLKAAGGKFDVATVHPYPPTGVEGFDDGTTAPNITLSNFEFYVQDLDKLWKGKRYPIWITEFGAQSTPDRNGAARGAQALFVKQALRRLVNRFPRVTTLVWFMLRDEPLEVAGQSDKWQSGLRDINGKKKPAYAAWVRMVETIL
jgi:hypothetical protein